MTSQEVRVDQVDRIVSQWERERPDLDVSPVEIFGRIARVDILLGKFVNDFLMGFRLCLVKDRILGVLELFKACSQHSIVSTLSAGLKTFKFGIDRKPESCSIG